MRAKSGKRTSRKTRARSLGLTKFETRKPKRGRSARAKKSGTQESKRGHIAYLSLGANRGDRSAQIDRALDLLARSGVRIVKRSSLYETEPVGFGDQHWFLNCVVECETEFMPRQLLRAAQRIEREMGRRRDGTRNAPRPIDIDILFFGTAVMRTSELEIPHPRIAERRFVLAPLAEIAPSLRHPTLHLSAVELLAATSDRSQVRRVHL